MKNKTFYYISTFLLTIFLFFIITILTNHLPLGNYLFNYADSFSMYPALLVHNIRSFQGSTFFYNLHSALGTDFYNLKTLYMNSPLNYLLIFFKENQVFTFYTFLIFLRIGLSSWTMSIYLNSLTKDKYTYKQFLFSLCYAFSSYALANSVHIMWMDSFWLLPLLILSLDKLIKENRKGLYIFFLSLTIFINFYIGYMICLFCLLYFIYQIILQKKYSISLVKNFLISSLLSALICSIILIPQIFSLLNGRGAAFDLTKLQGISTFSLATLPVSVLSGSYHFLDNFSDGTPLLYCSVFVIVLNILYYFNSSISRRAKVCTITLTVFFIISLFVHFIDYSWNMFQEPVWWSHRYSFVIVFFLIITAYQNYLSLDKVTFSKKQYFLILIIFLIISIASFFYKSKAFAVEITFIIGYFLSILLFALYFNIHSKYYKHIICFSLILELSLNSYFIFQANKLNTKEVGNNFLSEQSLFTDLTNYDKNFYRTSYFNKHQNDSLMFNFYSGELFASSYDQSTKDFLANKINYIADELNMFKVIYNNPAYLSLFNFKYIVGSSNYYREVPSLNTSSIKSKIYINNDVLPLGLLVPHSLDEYTYNTQDTYNNINKMYSTLLNYSVNLYQQTPITNYEVNETLENEEHLYTITYSFVAPLDSVITPDTPKIYHLMNFEINNEQVNKEGSDGIISLKKDDQVKVKIILTETERLGYNLDLSSDLGITLLNLDHFTDTVKTLQTYPSLTDIKTNHHVLEGRITSLEGGTMFLSIPYNESFTIRLDGKVIPYQKALGTFISFEVPKQTHFITIDYRPKGFKIGYIMSLIALILTLIYLKEG